MKLHVKTLKLPAQQVKAIQDCRGEAMKMTKHIPPVRWVASDLLKILVRGSTRRVCSNYKIRCDRV